MERPKDLWYDKVKAFYLSMMYKIAFVGKRKLIGHSLFTIFSLLTQAIQFLIDPRF